MDRVGCSNLFPNHIRTALGTHPHLVYTASLYVDAVSDAVSGLLAPLFRIRVLWVRNGKLAAKDDMCREASV